MIEGFSGKTNEATRACEPTVASNRNPNLTRITALPSISAPEGVVQPRFGAAYARIQGVTCGSMP